MFTLFPVLGPVAAFVVVAIPAQASIWVMPAVARRIQVAIYRPKQSPQSPLVLEKARDLIAREMAEMRRRDPRPDTWAPLHSEAIDAGQFTYVIWYDDSAFELIVDLLDRSDRLVASRKLPASHEPIFGLDLYDWNKIYADDGLIAQTVRAAERAPTAGEAGREGS